MDKNWSLKERPMASQGARISFEFLPLVTYHESVTVTDAIDT